MRILFSTTAGAGHFGPLVPFARYRSAAEVQAAAIRDLPSVDDSVEVITALAG